eukprot:XP_003727756.1 PREDICTED: uncharacterized protein LOC100888200 isoform X2 [Strongylocentrotus purpuratus]
MAHGLKRISYATCDPDYGQFAFLARNPKGPVGVQYCHVFITQEDYEAEEINAIISKAFKVAYASIRSKKQFYELVDELNREQEEYFTQITRLAEEEELKAKRPEVLMANQPVLSSDRVRGFSVGQSKVWAKQQAGKIQHKQPHLIAAMEAPPTLPTQPCDLSRGPLPPLPASNHSGSLGSRLSEPAGDPSMRDSWVIVDPDSEVDPDGRPMSPSAPPLSPKDAYSQEPVAKQTQKSKPLPPAPYYEVDFYNEWSLQSALGRNSALSVVSETDSNTSCQILLQDEHPPPALIAGIAPAAAGPHSTGQILLQDSSVPPPFVYGGRSGSENSFDDMTVDDVYAFENYKMDFTGRESVISAGSFDEEANFRYQLKCAEQFINAVYDVDSTEEDFARPKLSFRDKLKRKDHSEREKENGHRQDDGDSALGEDEAERRGNISHGSDDSVPCIQNGHVFKMTGDESEDESRERCRADYAVPRTPAKAVEPSAPPRPPPPPTSQEEGPSERKRPVPAPRRISPEIVVSPPSSSNLLKVDPSGVAEQRPLVPRRPSADSNVILNGAASIVAAVSPMMQSSSEGLSRSSSRSNVIDPTPSNAAVASSQRFPQSQQSTMQIGQSNGLPQPRGAASSRYSDTNSSNNPRTQLDEARANSIVDTTYSGTPGSPDKRSLRSPGHVGHKVEVEIGQFRCKKIPLKGGPPPLPPRSTSLTEIPDDDDEEEDTAQGKGVVAPWFKAGIPKEIAFEILHQQEKGAFIVRESKSHPGSYALSMKVDTNFNDSSLANYLLVRSKNGGYTIKGFGRDFPDLPQLVHFYTLHQDQLPCKLVISGTNPLYRQDAKGEMSDSDDEEDPDYRRVTDYKVMLEGAQ